MASASLQFGNLTAGNGNYIFQGIQNAPLTSALDRTQFRHGNPPPLNRNFLGRKYEIAAIRTAFREAEAGKQKRYVIYGMAGIGKSEMCVKLINDMQSEFWGIFWIDVSDLASAEGDFKKIADQIRPGMIHQTLEHALSALAEVNCNTHPWLLILDNADERTEDYARFLPSVPGGSIIISSRNHESAVHETIGSSELEPISFKDSVYLLLKAAKVRQQDWESYRPQAETITELLGSHTLTLIQAGAFISRDIRNWNQYPRLFKENRKHLLTTSWNQAQSKYGHVYAAFEVSAQALESDVSTEAKDALCLLGIFAMFHHSGFPTSLLADASEGCNHLPIEECSDRVSGLSAGLTELLPELLSQHKASTLRLQSGLYCLETISFIKQTNINDQDGERLVSMHPLAHAWAKDRLDQRSKEHAWLMGGSIVALSTKTGPQSSILYDYSKWELCIRQLQAHISSFVDSTSACMPRDMWKLEGLQINYAVTKILNLFLLHRKLESFLLDIFEMHGVQPSKPESSYLLPFYCEMAEVLSGLGKYQSSLDLWQHIIDLQEATSAPEDEIMVSNNELACVYLLSGAAHEALPRLQTLAEARKKTLEVDDNELLNSQYALGLAYLKHGQVNEAAALLEHVVRILQSKVLDTDSNLLTSQITLGEVYLENGQTKEAIELFQQVFEIRQRILPENSRYLIHSQYCLGCALKQAGRCQEALKLFEHIVRIQESTLPLDHPQRSLPLCHLAELYIRSKQLERGKKVMLEIENISRGIPKDSRVWCDVEQRLAFLKQEMGKKDGSCAFGKRHPDLVSDTGADSKDRRYETEVASDMSSWKRFARRVLKRDQRKRR